VIGLHYVPPEVKSNEEMVKDSNEEYARRITIERFLAE